MEQVTIIDAKQYGIEETKANELIGNLPQIQSERLVLEQQYKDVIELDIEDLNTSKIAKELRLKIVKNRTQGIGVWHKTTKDFFLKGGQFVDAIKRKEEAVNIQMEETLEAIEKHAENKEKERLELLQQERLKKIEPFLENTFGLDLANMSDEMFENFLLGSKSKHEAKIEAERLEAERIEKERLAEIERQKAIEAENLRLKKEAEEKEKALEKERKEQAEKEAKLKAENEAKIKTEQEKQAKERAEAEAKLKTEREAKEKLEAEIESKKQAEEKAEKERLDKIEADKKEAEKLAKAPIKKQLNVWVDSFELPKSTIENEKTKLILEKFEAFKKWSKEQVETI